jgi:hypothetical protein
MKTHLVLNWACVCVINMANNCSKCGLEVWTPERIKAHKKQYDEDVLVCTCKKPKLEE